MSDRKSALDSLCKVLGFNSAEKVESFNYNVEMTKAEMKEINKQLENDY